MNFLNGDDSGFVARRAKGQRAETHEAKVTVAHYRLTF
jgi:hypothetical protein